MQDKDTRKHPSAPTTRGEYQAPARLREVRAINWLDIVARAAEAKAEQLRQQLETR
jgi:hypothetical protein